MFSAIFTNMYLYAHFPPVYAFGQRISSQNSENCEFSMIAAFWFAYWFEKCELGGFSFKCKQNLIASSFWLTIYAIGCSEMCIFFCWATTYSVSFLIAYQKCASANLAFKILAIF